MPIYDVDTLVEKIEQLVRDYTEMEAELAEARLQLAEAQEQIAAKDAALRALRWKSIDKDNMEYQATVTYSEMDAIRAALAKETGDG
jgi:chromosome segregation ATPase